ALIRHAAVTGKDMYISTGMMDELEIVVAEASAYQQSNKWPTMMACSSAYPAERFDWAKLDWMSETLGSVGLSDHSLGHGIACGAYWMIKSVEKHLTLSRDDGGPDAAFSMEPNEFRLMVDDIKRIADSNATLPDESAQRKLRRSLWWARDIEAGETVKQEDIMTMRPALGEHPFKLQDIVGRKLSISVKANTPCLLASTGGE
ncbi:MAG: N-acetylneuraminate synthase family protein, partial [bacterium]